MNWRGALAFLGVIVIAVLLAFPLREVVSQLIIPPLAYVLWLLNLLYLSLDQRFWWIGVAVILFFILAFSLLPELKLKRKVITSQKQDRGGVEILARAFQKADKGIYFKWLVANRLGKLAYQMLLQREHGKPRSVFAPLAGEGWDANPEIQQYLEKGLHGSFAEFPNTAWGYLSPPEKTPLDHDVKAVIEFLESQQQGDSHL
jgi:hypothetical protein